MIAIFDTNAFYNLVKYYLPLDKKGELMEVIKINYEAGEIRLIDKVFLECKWTQKGYILDGLDFLTDKSLHINTTEILPSAKFFGYVEKEFVDHTVVKQKEHTEPQLEEMKRLYLESADCKLMLYAQSLAIENAFIVTEETRHGNDGKVHKKIPTSCDLLGVECMPLTDFLNKYFSFEISSGYNPSTKEEIPF